MGSDKTQLWTKERDCELVGKKINGDRRKLLLRKIWLMCSEIDNKSLKR